MNTLFKNKYERKIMIFDESIQKAMIIPVGIHKKSSLLQCNQKMHVNWN